MFGICVGEDEYGNKYYINKQNKKRWVVYDKIDETSKIPQMWHAWIHGMLQDTPQETRKFSWQGDHIPNTTGTGHFNIRHKTRTIHNFWKPQ